MQPLKRIATTGTNPAARAETMLRRGVLLVDAAFDTPRS
jgi:hypothetical protein